MKTLHEQIRWWAGGLDDALFYKTPVL